MKMSSQPLIVVAPSETQSKPGKDNAVIHEGVLQTSEM